MHYLITIDIITRQNMTSIIVVLFIVLATPLSWALHPVLLVPGDGGSLMMARNIESAPHYICGHRDKWFVLWLNFFYLTPVTLECFVDTVKLEYNPENGTTHSPEFCETAVNGFGTSDAVEYFSLLRIKKTSYFFYVIEDLVNKLGYVPNKSIRGTPYDFRKAPNEMASFQSDIKILIEQMYRENFNKSVIVMAHSMGNMYIMRLLNRMPQSWKDTYIHTFISISPPYSGAVDAVRTALSGNNEHIFILNPIDLREAQSTWPSTYYLMPIASSWSKEVIVATDEGNYTASSLPQLLRSSKIPFAEDHLKDIMKITEIPVAPNVPVYCIYSDNVPTPEFIDYRGGNFPNNRPWVKFGAGDGTVNLQSLKQCTNWQSEQTQPVITAVIESVAHLEIMRDKRLVDYVTNIIEKAN